MDRVFESIRRRRLVAEYSPENIAPSTERNEMTTDSKISRLSQLTPSTLIVFGGNRQRVVGPEIAEKFQDGDELFVLQDSGDLLHIPSGIRASVDQAVSQAATAFEAMPALAPS